MSAASRTARPRRSQVALALAALVAISVPLACGTPGAIGQRDHRPTPPGYQPATVADCTGVKSHFTAPPERVVALTPSVLEPLYWLGVADRVVGVRQRPREASLPARFRPAAQRLTSLSGEYTAGSGYQPPPKEELLATQPDLVLGGFSSNFDSPGAMSQQDLAGSGIHSYLALSTSCSQALSEPQTDLGLVYRDVTNLARMFGVPDRGERLVTRMRGQVSAVQQRVRTAERPSVFPFEFDEGTVTPYAPGNRQTVNAVIELAGGRNIFADRDKAYQKVGWESIVARNPDVILIIIYDNGSPEANAARFAEAKRFLQTFPPIRDVSAVRQQRFATLIYETSSVGGVRNADAVEALSRQLHPPR